MLTTLLGLPLGLPLARRILRPTVTTQMFADFLAMRPPFGKLGHESAVIDNPVPAYYDVASVAWDGRPVPFRVINYGGKQLVKVYYTGDQWGRSPS